MPDKGGFDMKSRLFSLLLSVTLIFGLLPTAFASGVTITGTSSGVVRLTGLDLTGEVNYTTTTGETTTADATAESVTNSAEGWQWDIGTKTLTLSGAYILCSDEFVGLRLPDGAKIVLQADSTNVIRSADGNSAYPPANAGIWAEGSLEFAGTGSLAVTSGKTWYTDDPNDSENMSCGIYLAADGSSLLISGGRITIASGDTGAYHTAGIYSENADITVSGGTVTVSSGDTAIGGNSYGIYTGGMVSVTGGTLNAFGGLSAWNSCGIAAINGMTITGGTTNAKGGWATEETSSYSYGIFTIGNLTINNPDTPGTNDGKVYSFGGVAANSYGIFFGGGGSLLNMHGGTLMASGDQAVEQSYGVFNNGMIALTGGITVFQASIGSTAAHASNIDPGFGTSTVTTVTPVGLAPGDNACNQALNVFAPSGTMHLRTDNLDISLNNVTQGNLTADGYHWDTETNVLTLDGLCVANTSGDGIVLPADATMQLADGSTNLVKRIGTDTINQAIRGNSCLTIQGDGTLFALGGYTTNESRGIYLEGGYLNILSGEILAVAGNGSSAEGILTAGGSINISSGHVLAMGGSAPLGNFSQGIRCGADINLTGSARVVAIGNVGKYASTGMVAGITGGGDINISAQDTLAISSVGANESIGLSAQYGKIILSGENLTVRSGFSNKISYGISAAVTEGSTQSGSVTIGGGNTQILAGTGMERSIGIFAEASILQQAGELVAWGGTSSATAGYSFGIQGNSTVELDDGICLGLSSYALNSTGITGALNTTGGLLIGAGGLATEESCGIQGASQIISGGTVWGVAGSAPYSRGIFGYTNGVTVNTGIVHAIGGQSGGNSSYGLEIAYLGGPITLNGGKIIARTLDVATNLGALSNEPVLTGGSVTLRDGAFDGMYALYVEACDVAFDANGGTAVAAQHPDYDDLITGSTTTTRSGYHLKGWYYQDPKTSQWVMWDFANQKVFGDLTLKAQWQKLTSSLIVANIGNITYTGSQIKPLPVVQDGTKILVKGTDYTLSYGTNISTGKGTVNISGIGNYYGSLTKTFYIVPKSLTGITVTLNETYADSGLRYRAIKATWTSATGATGYLVKYRKSTTTTWSSAYVTKNSWSILSPYAGAKYYVKVKPYITIDGVKYYSAAYSPEKAVYTLKAPATHLHKSGTRDIKVDWSNIAGETGYKIYRKVGTSGSWTLVKTIASTSTFTWSDAGRTVGHSYYYKVRAYRTVNSVVIYGPYSNTASLVR